MTRQQTNLKAMKFLYKFIVLHCLLMLCIEVNLFAQDTVIVPKKKGYLLEKGKLIENKKFGKWQTFYDSGKIATEKTFVNDQEQGEFTEWNEDGTIQNKGRYSLDKELFLNNDTIPFTGTLFVFYDNGVKRNERPYLNGLMSGISLFYYKNGNLFLKCPRLLGLANGELTYYHENGAIDYIGNYIAGLEEGIVKEWYNDGNLLSEYHIKHGLLEGKSTEWHQNGTRKLEEFYKNDENVGSYKEWHENKQLKKKGKFGKNGYEKGIWKEWDENGKLIKRTKF